MTDLCDVKGCRNAKDPASFIEVFVPSSEGGGWGSPRRGFTARIQTCQTHYRIIAGVEPPIGAPVE